MVYVIQVCWQLASRIRMEHTDPARKQSAKPVWWTEELSETCRVLLQNKFEKLVHLVGFTIRIYHDARCTMHDARCTVSWTSKSKYYFIESKGGFFCLIPFVNSFLTLRPLWGGGKMLWRRWNSNIAFLFGLTCLKDRCQVWTASCLPGLNCGVRECAGIYGTSVVLQHVDLHSCVNVNKGNNCSEM